MTAVLVEYIYLVFSSEDGCDGCDGREAVVKYCVGLQGKGQARDDCCV